MISDVELRDRLVDSYWKTERARQHLDELKAEVLGFMNADPCAVSVEEDTERRVRVFRAIFKQPHVWMYLIAGDVFQCLRTALDQAVWWFASQGGYDSHQTEFPIFDTKTAETMKRFDKRTKGVPANAVALIEAFQPYNRPSGAPLTDSLLWQLHEINRIDKHRRISVRATAAEIETLPVADVTAIESGIEVSMPFDAGPAFEPCFTPIVVFGDRGISITVEGIERIYGLVAGVILPRLAGCV